MIVEGILSVLFGFFRVVVGLFPSGNAPAWLSTGAEKLGQLASYAEGLGAWVPFTLAGTVLVAVLSCVAVGFAIKLLRIVVSLFTAGGGSAA